MKKKGFTLVELLAVIAILAILVILALPNIIGLYNSAKQESFLTEVKSLASSAEKQYMSNQVKGDNTRVFSSKGNKLEMTGKELDYYIELDSNGKIKTLKVSNGTWIATLPSGKDVADLTKDDLVEGNLDGQIPENVVTKSFSVDSWETIISNVRSGNTSSYNVGDEKEVDLGETYGIHTLRIANMSTPEECSTEGFSQTACGFVLEFTDVISVLKMNYSITNSGGWPNSKLYGFLNVAYDENNSLRDGQGIIYNELYKTFGDSIIDTKVISSHGGSEEDNFISTDKLYLLAPKEIYADYSNPQYDTSKDFSRLLDYYGSYKDGVEKVTTSNYSRAIKYFDGSAVDWWFRSACSWGNDYFLSVKSSGGEDLFRSASKDGGVSPAFRIG